MLIAHKGEHIAIREMRRHAAWYTKGLPHAAEIRLRLNQAESRGDFARILAALSDRRERGNEE
jgi:tRNA-dihydrouridine synthase B